MVTPADNPLLSESQLPLRLPPFDRIESAHFAPAFERGMRDQLREIEEIATNPEPPTFENVLVPLERSGRLLQRVKLVFFNLVGAHTNPRLEELRSEISPKLSAHSDTILLDERLFRRIEAVRDRLEGGASTPDPEARRLVERYHLEFVRAGARLDQTAKLRLKRMNAELARLQTRFSQNVLAEVNASAVMVDSPDELRGLSPAEIESARRAAEERGHPGKLGIPLQNTSGQPVVGSLDDRELRRRIFEASLGRNSRGGPHDNRDIVSRVVRLRAERARLLGYASHAAYVLEDQDAESPDAVNQRLAELAPPAVRNACREADALQRLVDEDGGGFRVEPWDWAYYAERRKREELALDDTHLKPYFELDAVLERGVFHAAERLFGLTFRERHDLPTYHPDVRVFEVSDRDDTRIALYLADLYARPSKRGGAWMNAYVRQSHLLGDRPVVANHQNIQKPSEGRPTLLTFDEVTTLFHEFGHALHGMLSDVRYPFFSGTAVPRDFVEFPSQLNEVWALWPEILRNFAVHHETREPIPEELVEKLTETKRFNQGYATTEYLAAAVLDQALHQLAPEDVPEAEALLEFERQTLREAGLALGAVPPRYRIPYFSHIMGGYAAGYYSYIWAEVLDADAVAWFEERGGPTSETGEHLRRTVLSRGGSREPREMYREFRGRDAEIAPLLERRGLAGGD